jgi:hypothetical protein
MPLDDDTFIAAILEQPRRKRTGWWTPTGWRSAATPAPPSTAGGG